MKQYWENLKYQAQQQPFVAAGIAAIAVTAVAKLMQANTERVNAKTWTREVDRRRMMSAK